MRKSCFDVVVSHRKVVIGKVRAGQIANRKTFIGFGGPPTPPRYQQVLIWTSVFGVGYGR